jgi:membrane-bound serine protease (ClpP class)
MLIGMYGLIFEFLNPGAVLPGLVGGISLLVALYALSLLPINLAGAALLLLGIGLMLAEVHIGAFGIIGVAGIIAFVIGAIMMFPEGAPGFELSPLVIAVATLLFALLVLAVLAMFVGSRRRPIVTGREALVGSVGEIVSWEGMDGRVRVEGEVWRAHAEAPLLPGRRVRVIRRNGLVLAVEPE